MFDITVKEFIIHMKNDMAVFTLSDSDHEECLFEGTMDQVKKTDFADRKIDTFSISSKTVVGAPKNVFESIMGSTRTIPKIDIKLK